MLQDQIEEALRRQVQPSPEDAKLEAFLRDNGGMDAVLQDPGKFFGGLLPLFSVETRVTLDVLSGIRQVQAEHGVALNGIKDLLAKAEAFLPFELAPYLRAFWLGSFGTQQQVPWATFRLSLWLHPAKGAQPRLAHILIEIDLDLRKNYPNAAAAFSESRKNGGLFVNEVLRAAMGAEQDNHVTVRGWGMIDVKIRSLDQLCVVSVTTRCIPIACDPCITRAMNVFANIGRCLKATRSVVYSGSEPIPAATDVCPGRCRAERV